MEGGVGVGLLHHTAGVLDGPQAVVLDQAENRLHMQKAILVELLSAHSKITGKSKK